MMGKNEKPPVVEENDGRQQGDRVTGLKGLFTSMPPQKGECKPPYIHGSVTCSFCQGKGEGCQGQDCPGCAGQGYHITYEIASQFYRMLASARSLDDLRQRLLREATRRGDRELVYRINRMHHHADLASVEAVFCRVIAQVMSELMGKGDRSPPTMALPRPRPREGRLSSLFRRFFRRAS